MNSTTPTDIETTHLPPIPPGLQKVSIGLRRETSEDRGFLLQLYLSGRWEELAPTGWPPDSKQAFLMQQFEFQRCHYRNHYPAAAWGIITLSQEPIGRLYLHRTATDLRIVDISIEPGHRGRGIGAGLIRAVLAQATAAGISVSLHVEIVNRDAERLYERLGFTAAGDDGVYRRMDWVGPNA